MTTKKTTTRTKAKTSAPKVVENPWLVGAEVRVRGGYGLDSHVSGTIVGVTEAETVHIVDVHLATGRVVRFLSTQLVLA